MFKVVKVTQFKYVSKPFFFLQAIMIQQSGNTLTAMRTTIWQYFNRNVFYFLQHFLTVKYHKQKQYN